MGVTRAQRRVLAADAESITWRYTRSMRLIWYSFSAVGVALGLLMLVTGLRIHAITSRVSAGGTPTPNLITGLSTLAVAVVAVEVVRRTRVTLGSDFLIVCNGVRAHRIELADISRLSTFGVYGPTLLIYYTDGERSRHISASASQGHGGRTRTILEAVEARRRPTNSPANCGFVGGRYRT